MKHLSVLLIILSIAGCAGSGRVIQTTFDPVTGEPNRVELSEYFQSKALIANEKLLAHLIVTLGSERVPKGYTFTEKIDRFQDQIEEVTEIYFTNNSSEPIEISNVYLQNNSQRQDILPQTMTIPPGKWVKTEPIVEVTSVYRPNIESVLCYTYMGKQESASLPQIRTPVSEL